MPPITIASVGTVLVPTAVFAVGCVIAGIGYWRWASGRATARPRRLAAWIGGLGITGFGVVGIAVTFFTLGLHADVVPPGGKPLPPLQQVGIALPWLAIALVTLVLSVVGVVAAVGLEAYETYAERQ